MSGLLLILTAVLAAMLIAVLAIDYLNANDEPTPLPLEHRKSDEPTPSRDARR